ncbi:MAG: tetratricopeptide repeat protein [Muribaculaceae bacterium]|nr:tetratricopeptide repeat protein [Muribaculaceae bacterium]
MKKSFTSLLIIFLTCAALLPGTPAFSVRDRDGVRAKARHYYLAGSVALASGRASEGYELFKKAVQTDPGYSEAAYSYASLRMQMRNDTLFTPAEVDRSIALMRPFVDEYPADTGEAMDYSFATARAGRLDEAIRVAERSDSLSPGNTTTLLQLAHYYALGRDYDKAISTLNRFERIEGPNPDLALRKYALMFSKGDTLGLLGESSRLVKENPLNPEYIVIRGNVFEALEMPDSALTCYLDAERLDPDDGRVKLTLANYWLSRGDSVAYDAKSSEAMLSENLELEEKLEMMTRYMQNIISDSTADRRRGARLFDGLLRQYPHEPQVLNLGAQYSSAVGDFERAEELMAYATDLDAENPDYWGRLAAIYYSDNKYEEAIATCLKAMEKLPEVPESVLFVYGAAAAMTGDYDKVREIYGGLLEKTLPGVTLSDTADQVFAKASRKSYEDLRKGADLFQRAADASFQGGDLERAIREYEVVVAIDGSNMLALNNLAYYLALAGRDLDRAEELSRITVEEQPDNPTCLDTLAWILYLKGEYEEALELQTHAVELFGDEDGSHAEFYDHLGAIQYRNGMRDKALENWKKAHCLDPDNKDISEKIRLKKIP